MGMMVVFGIAAVIIISLVVIAAVSQVVENRFNQEQLHDDAEKPKRDRLILTEDGELLEIVDSGWEEDEKPKRVYELRDTVDRVQRLEDGYLSGEREVKRKSR